MTAWTRGAGAWTTELCAQTDQAMELVEFILSTYKLGHVLKDVSIVMHAAGDHPLPGVAPSVQGTYRRTARQIDVKLLACETETVATILHELGHHVWATRLSNDLRWSWRRWHARAEAPIPRRLITRLAAAPHAGTMCDLMGRIGTRSFTLWHRAEHVFRRHPGMTSESPAGMAPEAIAHEPRLFRHAFTLECLPRKAGVDKPDEVFAEAFQFWLGHRWLPEPVKVRFLPLLRRVSEFST